MNEVNWVQYANAESPNEITLSGKLIALIFVLVNAPLPTVSSFEFSANVTVAKLEQ